MTDHNSNLAGFHEACADEDMEEIETDHKTLKGKKKISQAHSPLKLPNLKKQGKGDQKKSDGNVSDAILHAVQTKRKNN